MGPKAQGIVKKISTGWPTNIIPSRRYDPPAKKWLEHFDKYTKMAMDPYPEGFNYFVERDQWDFDIDCFMEYANFGVPDGEPRPQINTENFKRCIYHYSKQNYKWT
jgi:hypothetical protein